MQAKVVDDKVLAKEHKKEFEISRISRFRCRTRYFTDSGIIGSKEFVSVNYQRFKNLFDSKHEKKPKPIKGLDGIYSLKRLSEFVWKKWIWYLSIIMQPGWLRPQSSDRYPVRRLPDHTGFEGSSETLHCCRSNWISAMQIPLKSRVCRLLSLTLRKFLIVGWAVPTKYRWFHLLKVGQAHPTLTIQDITTGEFQRWHSNFGLLLFFLICLLTVFN